MNCGATLRLLDAHVDNELDVRSELDVHDHLLRCATCRAEEQNLLRLQASAREHLTRYDLPPGLQARLATTLREVAPREREPAAPAAPALAVPAPAPALHPAPVRRWSAARWGGPAVAAAAVVLVAIAVPGILTRPRAPRPDEAIFAAHVHSLLADHLTDVASSDQHTVKPWFQGKLDYSIDATDLAAAGFELVGGRLDYLDDAPAASVVYRRGKHAVNLFVRPSDRGDEPPRRSVHRGYRAWHWTRGGMERWAVSDLNDADLRRFVELVQRDEQ